MGCFFYLPPTHLAFYISLPYQPSSHPIKNADLTNNLAMLSMRIVDQYAWKRTNEQAVFGGTPKKLQIRGR